MILAAFAYVIKKKNTNMGSFRGIFLCIILNKLLWNCGKIQHVYTDQNRKRSSNKLKILSINQKFELRYFVV